MNSSRFAASRHAAILALGIVLVLSVALLVGCTTNSSSSSAASGKAQSSESAASSESATEWLAESASSASASAESSAAAESQERSNTSAPTNEDRSSQTDSDATQQRNNEAETPGGGKAPGTRSDESTYILRDANGKDTIRIYAVDGYDYFDTLSEGHKYVWEKSHDDSLGGICITLLYTEETMDEYFEAMDKWQNDGGSQNVAVHTERNGNVDITWHVVKEEGGKQTGYYGWVTDGKHNVTVEYASPNPVDAPDHMTEDLYHAVLLSVEFI